MATTPASPPGSLTYHARVVHNDRQYISIVSGRIDFAMQAAEELVDESYLLDWQRMPGGLTSTHPMLPALWQVGSRTAHRFGQSMPHYENPRLRHFIVSEVIGGPQSVQPGMKYLADQLLINTATYDEGGFEIVAQFRGAPLVIVGSGKRMDGYYELADMVVLGPQHELYQYFFDEITYSPQSLNGPPALPGFEYADYVSFPESGGEAVAIRPVKDWLVFQAHLPDGRPLNLVFDSGAETMILDDMVLKLDAKLAPVGRVVVAGALELGEMELYEGLSFDVGGVQFENLTVLGAPLTSLGIGADLRIHGIVGSEILQLCQLDLDLNEGQMRLLAHGAQRPSGSQEVPLTFIEELPHIEAEVHDTGRALLLLDTGQRTALTVNWDWLESYEMDEDLKMDGFLGDVTGGFLPRYIVEELDLSLAGQRYTEKTVSAAPDSTFTFAGLPVVGAIGFPLLARHFGGITFDYSLRRVFLREPAAERVFTGRPEAWETQGEPQTWRVTTERSAEPPAATGPAAPSVEGEQIDTRRPELLPESPGNGGDPRQNYSWFEYWEKRKARNSAGGAGEFARELGNTVEKEAGGALSDADLSASNADAGALALKISESHGVIAREVLELLREVTASEEADAVTDEVLTTDDVFNDGRRLFKRGLPKLKFR